MNWWRMQLHPNEPESATFYASQSLAAGFIGLDFATEVGDLLAEDHPNMGCNGSCNGVGPRQLSDILSNSAKLTP